MTIMSHAKEMAAAIITKQKQTMTDLQTKEEIQATYPVIQRMTKKTETVGPDTEIRVSTTGPATIISEEGSGSIEELVVISPNPNFSVFIQSNGGNVKLEKTWTELSRIGEQAKDISAFQAADSTYVLNIKDYSWQVDMLLMLRSTNGSFKFNQVYANWFVYGG